MTVFDLGSYGADLVLTDKGYTKSLQDAEQKIESTEKKSRSLASTIGKVTVGAIATLGAALSAVAFQGVQANSSMEQYRATLNTVMADSVKAGETLNWVKQFAAQTPFEMPGLVEATVKLQAMGLEARKFLPLAGDMAAVFQSSGKTVGDAAEAINDAMMGEFERLKEFGIKLQQTDFKKGGKYAGKTFAEALEAEFKNHNYEGAALALSQTFSGRLSTLKDTVGMFIQDISGPLFDTLSVKMGDLIDKINELQANGTLQQWADNIKVSFTNAWDILENVGSTLVNIGQAISNHWDILEPVLTGIAAGAGSYLLITTAIGAYQLALRTATAVQLLFNGAMTANPIGIIVVALGALVAAGVYLYKNWDTVRINMKKIFDNIAYSAQSAISWMKIKILEGVQHVLNTISKFSDFIPGLSNKVNDLKSSISGMIDDEKVTQSSRNVQHELNQASYALELQEIQLQKLEESQKKSEEQTIKNTQAISMQTTKLNTQTQSIQANTKAQKEQTNAKKEAYRADLDSLRFNIDFHNFSIQQQIDGYKLLSSKHAEYLKTDIDAYRDSLLTQKRLNEEKIEELSDLRKKEFEISEKWISDEETRMRIAGRSEIEIATMIRDNRIRMASEQWTKIRGLTKLSADEQLQANKKLYESEQNLQNLIEHWKDSVKDVAKQSLDTIESIYEEQNKLAQESLDQQLDQFEEFIDDKKKLNDRANDTEDYQREVEKLQKEELELRKHLNILALDNSREGQAKKLGLEKELAEKLDEIEEHKRDRKRDLIDQNLDDQLDAKQKEIRVQKEAEETKWKNMLANDERYKKIREELLQGHTNKLIEVLGELSTELEKISRDIGASIDQNVVDKIAAAQNAIRGLGNSPTSPTSSSGSSNSSLPSSSSNQQAFLDGLQNNGTPGQQKWANQYEYLNNLTKNGNPGQQSWAEAEMKKNGMPKYHEGGIVGGKSSKQGELLNKIFNLNPNEQIVKSLKGELQIPPQNFSNFFSNMGLLLKDFMKVNNSNPTVAGVNNYHISVHVPNGWSPKQSNSLATKIVRVIENRGGNI